MYNLIFNSAIHYYCQNGKKFRQVFVLTDGHVHDKSKVIELTLFINRYILN